MDLCLPSVMYESAHFPTSFPALHIVNLLSFANIMDERCFSSRPITLQKMASGKLGVALPCASAFPPLRWAGSPSSFPTSLSYCLLLFPGFGNSAPSKEANTEAGRAELLERVLRDLEVHNAILVSPSLSGRYALPFLIQGHHQLRGFVPIAPASTQNYTQEQFWAVKVLEGGFPKVQLPIPVSSHGAGKDSCLTWRRHGLIWIERDGVFGKDFLRRWLEGQSPSSSPDHSPLPCPADPNSHLVWGAGPYPGSGVTAAAPAPAQPLCGEAS